MLNEFDEYGRQVYYTSDGKKIEWTEKGERIYEMEYDDYDWEHPIHTVGDGEHPITTTTWKLIRRKYKYYWGEWKLNQYDGPRQTHITDLA